jgi:peptide/nickel transport system substrate-binding protein
VGFRSRARFVLPLIVLLAGCAPGAGQNRGSADAEAPRATGPKRLTAAITGAPPTLVGRFDTSTNKPGWNETALLYSSGLTNYDGSNNVAILAERAASVENGDWKLLPDGKMETRSTIREGAAWHDGTPFTTKDLLFTNEVARDRELTQTIAASLAFVDKVEAIDARTINVTWKQPYIQADRFWGIEFLPAHILEKPYRDDKTTLVGQPYMTTDFVGNGPFRVTHFEQGQGISLAAFDRYVLGRPKIDEIEVKFIIDLSTLMANILANSVDVTLGRGLSTEQGIQLRNAWPGGKISFDYKSWLAFYGQYIDPNPAVVSDVRFHKGVMHALDRQQMVDTLEYGETQVAEISLDPKHPNFNEILSKAVRYDYNPRTAASYFEQIGYTRGADGTLRDAAGRPLEVEIRTTGELDIHLKTVAAMASDLRKSGMLINETVIPTLQAGDRPYRVSFPGLEMLRGPYGEDALTTLNHSSRIPTPENRYSSGNYPRYNNPQWDALLERYSVTIPRAERIQALTDVIRMLSDQLSQMSLFYDTQLVLSSNRLQNLDYLGALGWNSQTWDLKS